MKEAIVRSVAEQVQTSTVQTTEELNGDVNSFLSTYSAQIKSESGDVPFLTGISESKVDDWYWEKIKDKKKHETYYRYHIRYPFPQSELNALVVAYEKYDRKLTDNLNRQLDTIGQTTSLEALFAAYTQLQGMSTLFKDNRKMLVKSGLNEFKSILKSLRVVPVENKPGSMTVQMRSGTRSFTIAQIPQVSSPCAETEKISADSGYITISYNYDYCKPGSEENYLKFRFSVGNMRLVDVAPFEITSQRVEMNVIGTVYLKMIGNLAKLEIPVKTKYGTEFQVTRIDLEFPSGIILTFENQYIMVSGKGSHILKTDIVLNEKQQLDITKHKIVSGRIYYKAGENTGSYRIYKAKFRMK